MRGGEFRPIYYLGCKTSFATAIKAAIDEVDPSGGRLCDLFSGTGAIAREVASSRSVTTADIQEYSRILCTAMLCPARLTTKEILVSSRKIGRDDKAREIRHCLQPLIDYEHQCIASAIDGHTDPLVELIESPALAVNQAHVTRASRLTELIANAKQRLHAAGLCSSPDTTVTRLFGGVYFSYEQAVSLDGILSLSERSDTRTANTMKAAAISTASQIVNTVGKQFAQPLRPRDKFGRLKSNFVRKVKKDRSIDTIRAYQNWLGKYAALQPATCPSKCLRSDYLEALKSDSSNCSICYADPPYTRDHYSRFYHVLETMCLRDNPTISAVTRNGVVTSSRGLYREDRHQSPFCIRSQAPNAFETLFRAASARNLPLVLSYSPHELGDGTHPRVVSTQTIVELARAHYGRVDFSVLDGSRHNALNRTDLKLKTRAHAEVILKCFP